MSHFPKEVIEKVQDAFFPDEDGDLSKFKKLDIKNLMFLDKYIVAPTQIYDLRELNFQTCVHNVKRVGTTEMMGFGSRMYEKRIPDEKSYVFFHCWETGGEYVEW